MRFLNKLRILRKIRTHDHTEQSHTLPNELRTAASHVYYNIAIKQPLTMETQNTNTKETQYLRALRRIQALTSHTWIFSRLNNTLMLSLEYCCYLLLIGLVAFAIYLPDGSLNESQQVSENIRVDSSIKVQEIIEFFIILRLMIGALGLLMLVPAYLFRQVRKKNYKLEEVHDIIEKAVNS